MDAGRWEMRGMTRREALALACGGFAAVATACARTGEVDTTTSAPPTPTIVTVQERTTDASAPKEFKSQLARLLDAGEVRSVRLIGDSITAGFGCDGYGPSAETIIYEGPYGTFLETAPSVACWANELRAYLGERGVESVVNAGICGAKMRWLAEDPEAWVREGADVMFVMLGTNDAVYSSREEFAADAEAGLSSVATRCSHMVVLAPPDNDRHDAANLYRPDVLEEVLAGICVSYGWEFVSLLDAITLGTDEVNDDQCHPTTKGSHALWGRMRDELGI